MGSLNIGAAAKATGLSARMIRHYEGIGLLPASGRSASGYRTYGTRDLDALRLIRQARVVGFSTKEIATLIALWNNPRRASRKVRQLAQQRVEDLDAMQREIEGMRSTLLQLVAACPGDDGPDCAILDGLASASRAPARRARE